MMKPIANKTRMLLAWLLLCVLFACLPALATAADAVSYVERSWSGSAVTTAAKSETDYTLVAADTTAMSAGFYVVASDVTITERITVTGDVKLILADGKTLTAEKGVRVDKGNSLTIYGQTNDSGTLVAGGTLASYNETQKAAIGSDNSVDSGLIIICGGTVNASFPSSSYSSAAAIGGGNKGSGNVTIIGGTVNATAVNNSDGAAIGSGGVGSSGDVTIYGGNVNATSSGNGAAIGGGSISGGSVTINGGTVTANGTLNGAAIGGGSRASGSVSVTINGGTVNATDTRSGAAIGSGYNASGSITITINGGTVTATGYSGAGVGSGGSYTGSNSSVTLGSGAHLKATSYRGAVDKPVLASGANGMNRTNQNASFTNAVTYEAGDYYYEFIGSAHLTGDPTSNGDGTHSYPHPEDCVIPFSDGVTAACSGGPADCQSGAICSECGGEYGEKDPDNHTGTLFCTPNADGLTHEVAYACCGVVNAAESHTFSGDECAKCGYTPLPAVPYVERGWDGSKVTETEKSVTVYTPVTSATTEMNSGFYVVDGSVTIAERISVSGNVWLILTDGAELTAPKGMEVNTNAYLSIHGQTNDTGALTITSTEENNAGIGSNSGAMGLGNLYIHGGSITATGGKYGAGIGGGKGANGVVTIYGGTVDATGGRYAAGIGGGYNATSSSDVTIYGGTVNAAGGEDGAGIGGGKDSSNTNRVTIYGGTVDATGGENGAGIGGGEDASDRSRVVIYGGTVTAAGGDNGAAIGGGNKGSGTVAIDGGTVTANNGSFNYGAAIGGGNLGRGDVIINGGTVTATGYFGAGIGGGGKNGNDGSGGNGILNGSVIIKGGTVTASSEYGAGIGGGQNGTSLVTISGGAISATGNYGAGIGGGQSGTDDITIGTVTITTGTVTINGGTVTANGGTYAAGIGGGYGGRGTVTINGGAVKATSMLSAGVGSGFSNSGSDSTIKLGSGAHLMATGSKGIGGSLSLVSGAKGVDRTKNNANFTNAVNYNNEGYYEFIGMDHLTGDPTSNGDGTHSYPHPEDCAIPVSDGVTAACTGGTADCQNKAVCSVCNQAYGEKDADNHVEGCAPEYTDIGDGTHKEAYSLCGAIVKEKENHTFSGSDTCVCDAKARVMVTNTDGSGTPEYAWDFPLHGWNAGETATLLADVTVGLGGGYTTARGEITLDLGSYTLSFPRMTVTVPDNAEMTLTGSGTLDLGSSSLVLDGDLILSGGVIKSTGTHIEYALATATVTVTSADAIPESGVTIRNVTPAVIHVGEQILLPEGVCVFDEDNEYAAELGPNEDYTYTIKKHTHSPAYQADDDEDIISLACACGWKPGKVKLTVPQGAVYDGQPKPATVTGSIDGVTPALAYTKKDGTPVDEPIDAGDYTVTMTVGDKRVSADCTIAKATAPAPRQTRLNVSNGYAGDYVIDLSDLLAELPNPCSYGEISFAIKDIDFSADRYYDTANPAVLTPDTRTLTLPIRAVDSNIEGNIGQIILGVTTTNYVVTDITLPVFTVNRSVPDITPTITPEIITYGQPLSDIEISFTAPSGVSGVIAWDQPDTVYDAGTQDPAWTFTPAALWLYAPVSGTAEITVLKVYPTCTAPTAVEGLAYTGAAQALVTGGTAEGGTLVYSLTQDGEYTVAIPTGTDVGDYTVWYKVIGDANHNDTEPQCLTMSIAKAAATLIYPPAGAEDLVYDGTAQTLLDGFGKAEGGRLAFSLSEDDGYTYTMFPTGTDAGDYTVWYKVDGDANHSSIPPQSLTVTIAKADSTLTPPTAVEGLTYTGAALELVTGGEAQGGTLVYSLTEDGEYTDTIPTGTDVGDYTVWYKVVGDANHNDTVPQSLTAAIAKAQAAITEANILDIVNGYANVYTYDLKTLLPALGEGQSYGEVSYTLETVAFVVNGYYDEANPAAVSGETLTLPILAADTYEEQEVGSLTFAVTSANFDFPDGVTLTLHSVNRLMPYGLPTPTPGIITYGQPLSDVVLSGTMTGPSGETVTGVFTWKQPDTVYDAGEQSPAWVFTPDDLKTYSAVEGIVGLTVDKADPTLTPPTGAEGLVYTGEALDLLTDPGTAEGGTLVYSLTQDGEYTETLPTGTDAGDYTVWYKVAGDANHSDTEPQSLTVTIGVSDTVFTLFEVLNGETPATVFTYGDVIIVRVKPGLAQAADGEPGANQMALYYGDVQISEPASPDGDGVYTMVCLTSDKALPIGQSQITAAYTGTGNLAGNAQSANITLNPKPLTASYAEAQSRLYEAGNSSVTVTGVTLTGALIADDVSVDLSSGLTGTLASDEPGVYAEVTLPDPLPLTGADAQYYTLAGGAVPTQVEIMGDPSEVVPMTRLNISDGLRDEDIPETLRAKYPNAAAVEDELRSRLEASYKELAGTAMYNVVIEVSLDGGDTWTPAGPEDYPEGGMVSMIVALPEGSQLDRHNFHAAHMFTNDYFGQTPGSVELPPVTLTYDEEGAPMLSLTLNGLSPVMIGWTYVDGPDDLPQTGDTSSAALWLLLLGVSGAGAAIIARRRREEN
ncbi:MAG: LPXTG cell wall anchor domain-containing protein [Clostridia bacterium]|nr:LPXTG cell wall anchor domain-containing protein [Clostridia bacterium]